MHDLKLKELDKNSWGSLGTLHETMRTQLGFIISGTCAFANAFGVAIAGPDRSGSSCGRFSR